MAQNGGRSRQHYFTDMAYKSDGQVMMVRRVNPEKLPSLLIEQSPPRSPYSNQGKSPKSPKKGKISIKQNKGLHIPEFNEKILKQQENRKERHDSLLGPELDNDMESTSFRIKENMRAGTGITFREGTDHIDHGPRVQQAGKPGSNSYRYSLKEYS